MLVLRPSPNRLRRVLPFTYQHYMTHSFTRSYYSKSVVALLDGDTVEQDESRQRYHDTAKANFVFRQAWEKVEQLHGIENMQFPHEMLFLMGAPGAGKGTHTPFILKARNITNQAIGISQLLQSPGCQEKMEQGLLVSDGYVMELMLHAILQSSHPEDGVLVDGFPRSCIQSEMLILLHGKWSELWLQHMSTPLWRQFPQPNIKICLLHIDRETSIQRQLKRGRQTRNHNHCVTLSGTGELLEERRTDFDEKLMQRRYDTFQSNYYSLMQLATWFSFHLIDASGTRKQVEQAILKELKEQPSIAGECH